MEAVVFYNVSDMNSEIKCTLCMLDSTKVYAAVDVLEVSDFI